MQLTKALLLFIAWIPASTVAFATLHAQSCSPAIARIISSSRSTPASTTTTTLSVSLVPAEDMELARSAFFIWFFGASGAAGIARSSFPRMFNNMRTIQSLKDQGPTLGGETLGLPTFAVGYPKDLSIRDVEQVINNKLSVEQIVQKYPIENNFLSKGGYLVYDAFRQANAKCNPLAVRAIFDTFSQSSDAVEPYKAQKLIDSYKQDVFLVKRNLILAKAVGFAAIALLLFLLGFADIVAFGHAYNGWFPSWPGYNNFPACLIDPETGPWTIPDYWI